MTIVDIHWYGDIAVGDNHSDGRVVSRLLPYRPDGCRPVTLGIWATLPEEIRPQSDLVREMIGEAMPRFTEGHGKVLADLLDDGRPQGLLLCADRRVSNAAQKLEAVSAAL